MSEETKAVAKRSMLNELKMFLGAEDTAVQNRFFSILFRQLKDPKISGCTHDSKLEAARTLAVLGLDPDPALQLVYIIPYKGKATVQVDYRGYIELIRESGEFESAPEWGLVREHDKFRFWDDEAGTHLFHKRDINMTMEARGKIVGAWVRWWLKNSRRPHITVIGDEEIRAAKAKSMAYQSGKSDTPWRNELEEGTMVIKTCVRRSYKAMPKTRRASIAEQLEHENQPADEPPRKASDFMFNDAQDANFEDLAVELYGGQLPPDTGGVRSAFDALKPKAKSTAADDTQTVEELANATGPAPGPLEPATPQQVQMIKDRASDRGIDDEQLNALIRRTVERNSLGDVRRGNVVAVIEAINEWQPTAGESTDNDPHGEMQKRKPEAKEPPKREPDPDMDSPATEEQLAIIRKLQLKAGLDDAALGEILNDDLGIGVDLTMITRKDAVQIVEYLNAMTVR